MVVKDFERRVTDHADELLTYPDGSILIEMSYMYRSRNFEDVIFELGMVGITPIVAHPERYLYMADQLGDFDHWVDMGAKLQMNYLSLTGQYGEASLKILRHLLKHGLYSFVATDLHSLSQLDRILTTKVDSRLLSQLPPHS
jgi:tyrosine-protein phosphatase YwqE